MADNVSVTLDCRNFPSAPNSGYTNVTGSNNRPYSYRYTGGTDGKGNVTVRQGKPTNVNVTIQADARYHVSSTGVSNDPNNNISRSNATRAATFTDSAANVEADIEYQITVLDSVANATFVADPRIDNISR